MVKVTVVLCTRRREPHFEWALKSLEKQTFKDFEYLIIDGLWEQRKDDVLKIIKESSVSFPVFYLKDKASRWKGKRPALCAARNTALIFADSNSKYIVHADDNCKMPPNWLEKHLMWLEQGYIVAGNWYSDVSGWEYRSTVMKEAGFVGGGWLYGANFSFPLKVALDINGFSEDLDGELGQDDIDFGIRAERNGIKIMYDPTCYVEYDYTDHGVLMGYTTQKQKVIELNVIPVNIKLKDGLEHFSNEFFMQELLEDSERYLAKGNTIQIAGTRELWKSGKYSISDMYKMMEGWINADKYDWRDNRLISDKLRDMKEMK
jgi:glycosyltransferase involved in cell wall biosynthesis